MSRIASDPGQDKTRRLLDEHAEALRQALETARVAAIASEEGALTELSRQCAAEQAHALYELRASLEHATTALVATETRTVREAARDEAAKELERTVRAALVTTLGAPLSAF